MPQLSTREIDVLKLVADGKTYKEIAHILGLSSKTVDCYSQRIKLKTQVPLHCVAREVCDKEWLGGVVTGASAARA